MTYLKQRRKALGLRLIDVANAVQLGKPYSPKGLCSKISALERDRYFAKTPDINDFIDALMDLYDSLEGVSVSDVKESK